MLYHNPEWIGKKKAPGGWKKQDATSMSPKGLERAWGLYCGQSSLIAPSFEKGNIGGKRMADVRMSLLFLDESK